MASSEVGAKQLAMYADNPVRYCNLRGQLDGAGGAAVQRKDDDLGTATDPLRMVWRSSGLLGFVLALLGTNEIWFWAWFQLAGGQDFVGMLMLLAGTGLFFLGAWGWFNAQRLKRVDDICQRFDLDPAEFKIKSASIMGNRGERYELDGLVAVPHALFQRRGKRQSCHVALLLNRPYAGKVHDADLFRLTLQMGIIKRALGVRTVTGSIRYAGKLVKVAYSESLFNTLKGMGNEFRASVKQWWPQQRDSLRRRQQKAAGAMVRAREIEWPDEYLM